MPAFPIIIGNIHPTVVPFNNMCGVSRIDPHRMMIRVNTIVGCNGFPILATVITARYIRP